MTTTTTTTTTTTQFYAVAQGDGVNVVFGHGPTVADAYMDARRWIDDADSVSRLRPCRITAAAAAELEANGWNAERFDVSVPSEQASRAGALGAVMLATEVG